MQLQINNMNFSNLIRNLIITVYFVGIPLSYLFIPSTKLSTNLTEFDNECIYIMNMELATKAAIKAIAPSVGNI